VPPAAPLEPDSPPLDSDGGVGQPAGRGSAEPPVADGVPDDEGLPLEPCCPLVDPEGVCGPEPPSDELEEGGDDEGEPPEEDGEEEPPDDDGEEDGEDEGEPPDDDGEGMDGLGIEVLVLLVVAQPPAASAAASSARPVRPLDRFMTATYSRVPGTGAPDRPLQGTA